MRRSFLPRMMTRSDALSGDLPLDVQRDGARRLSIAAILYSVAYLIMAGLGRWLAVRGGLIDLHEAYASARAIPMWSSVVFGLVVFALTRVWSDRPKQLLDLGLVFLVLSTLGISFDVHFGIFPDWYPGLGAEIEGHRVPPGMPYECAWIVIFPVLVPNRPWRMLVAALLAASTGPFVVWLSQSLGYTDMDLPLRKYLVERFLFTTYVCALIAYVSSLTIYTLTHRIQQAREVGHYRLVQRLGEGGMGEVWEAEHSMLARPAAIKLIRPESLGTTRAQADAAIRRFEREAQSTAALRSFHTITLYDFGINDEGAFYYVMELLDGIDLEQLVRTKGPQPAARVLHVLHQACASLGEAHEQGLVHRDVKPANLFLCRAGGHFDWLKILDFGLVTGAPESGADATRLTQHGTVAGTPAYMAPEMVLDACAVDGRTDLYALACVGYWCLTGETVFEAETPMAMAVHHVQTTPERPSARTEQSIPSELEELLLRCLSKEPSQRPATAAELGAELAVLAARYPWTEAEAKSWWDLHRPSTPAVLAASRPPSAG